MNIFEAAVLGLIQGLTEFLPVSSSGHLVLAQKLFGINAPALLFDTFLHVGTLAAVIIVLWKDVWALLKKPFQRLTWLLIVATLPTVVVAVLFKDSIESVFSSGEGLGLGFLVTAAILFVSELLAARPGEKRGEAAMTWMDAVIIGLMQAFAILPSVSRSGSTIAGALSRRLDRDFAARFSFILSIPAILGALVFQMKDIADAAGTATASGGISWMAIVVGSAIAAVVGVLAVRLMLRVIKRGKLHGFAIYVAVLGVLVLIDQYLTHIVF